jgi:hypothetical protein
MAFGTSSAADDTLIHAFVQHGLHFVQYSKLLFATTEMCLQKHLDCSIGFVGTLNAKIGATFATDGDFEDRFCADVTFLHEVEVAGFQFAIAVDTT